MFTHKILGLDVGSTTVKPALVDPSSLEILWKSYHRHNGQQAESVHELLKNLSKDFSLDDLYIFITGSGGGPLIEPLNAKFVQEVNAVTMAVENNFPEVGSVVELGGQDAKIIIFKEDKSENGGKTAITSMNDKCASGTGATIDKCMIKVGVEESEIPGMEFDDQKLHHVAAKCGVFAETDIVNLVKAGLPAKEILCSLADAIVNQNLSVLTRGNTLRHPVILLGGPNTYLPFLQTCWRQRIVETWQERRYEYPKDEAVEDLIRIPENSLYYAAFGAALYGLRENQFADSFAGLENLQDFVENRRSDQLKANSGPPLVEDQTDLDLFLNKYKTKTFNPRPFAKGERVQAVIGLDGGSTSSKGVLIDKNGEVLRKFYQLSKGNPIQDTKDIVAQMKEAVEGEGATLEIMGFGVTGYAGDVLEKTIMADVNIVETVAHMKSAVHFFGEIDVICDIGGQDIKVLFMKNQELQNFKLSNQCSAGNGMLLQAMAAQFNVDVRDYSEHAFKAKLSPEFSYGCAVFLDSDRVNFQKEGYGRDELMAGLAQVLPKNVWQYVVQVPRLAEFGNRYVLQGGTQYNLAALKAQVEYIEERVPNAEIHVHPHTGEAGAIGAAIEALEVVQRKGYSQWVGIDQTLGVEYQTKNDESTRCNFCPNNCSRTFIDTFTPSGVEARHISGFSCENGTVESKEALKALKKDKLEIAKNYPNLVNEEAKLCYGNKFSYQELPGEAKGSFWKRKKSFQRSSNEAKEFRKGLRIGMPKVLNMWSTAPFFRVYLQTLGIDPKNIVFSDDSSEEMFAEGGKYGSIDPCYPSKVAQAHIHNLLFKKTVKKKLDFIYFPSITHIPTFLENCMDSATCPIVAGTPKVMRAAFTKEVDFFKFYKTDYVDAAITFTEVNYMKQQLFNTWKDKLNITEDESNFAADEGMKALLEFDNTLQERGRKLIAELEENGKMGLLLIGRPYHNDPGLNHGIHEEFQALGYPVLSMRSIPKEKQWLGQYFEDEETSIDITDVWPENYSTNSAQKVWAAKFAARHPNIAVLDLSSFKCGHDAPTYGIISSIVNTAEAPYSTLHDIDANKPSGSMKIRVKTYEYTLNKRESDLQEKLRRKDDHGESQRPAPPAMERANPQPLHHQGPL